MALGLKKLCLRSSDIKEECENTVEKCEAVFRTNGVTCDHQCGLLKLTCVKSWNSLSNQGNGDTCKLRGPEQGCGRRWNLQTCRCMVNHGMDV